MLDIEDKKVQQSLLLIAVIVIAILYFIFNQEEEYQMQMVKPAKSKLEKKEEQFTSIKKEIKKSISTKNTKKEVEEVKEQLEEVEEVLEKKLEEKKTILFSSSDSSGRYTIKLVSNIEISIDGKNSTRYVPMTGIIQENSEESSFTISLNENYLDYINDINLIVKDITNKDRKLECSASFLSGVNADTQYNLKLELSTDILTCYIDSEESLPEFILNELNKNSGAIIINTEEYNKGIEVPKEFEKLIPLNKKENSN